MFNHTRWRELIREFVARTHREARVTLSPQLKPDRWLFIVGCYNSGTTLVAGMLAEHPLIGSLPNEGQYLTDQLLVDYQIGLPRMWVEREDLFRMDESSQGPDIGRIRKEWSARINRRRAPVVLEKTPANMARTRWLQRNFPEAYFVGVIRNPYAVAAGIRKKAEPRHRRGGWPIEMCANQWVRSNRVLEEDAGNLRNFMWVRYEDVVSEPVECIDRILDFVHLPVSHATLGERVWRIHERVEPIRDLNPESTRDLSVEDIGAINDVAAADIVHFGYRLL